MKSKQSKFILLIIGIVIIVIGLGIASHKAQGPGKYDEFAKALATGGAEFYGAFWCPHCQTEKALFGTSKQYLPYIECSNPDQSQTAICIEKKIESYPTWIFKNGITLISGSDPVVCQPKPQAFADEPAICAQAASDHLKTWIFPEHKFSTRSSTDPVHTGDVWKFVAGSQTTGEIPLDFLAQQIGFTLPQ